MVAILAASSFAQGRVEPFLLRAPHAPTYGTGYSCFAVGDVDGDGIADLVCGYVGQNRLYLGTRNSAFVEDRTGRLPKRSETTAAVALADVDNDNDLDLVVASTASSEPDRLLLNDGKGRFSDAGSGSLPAKSQAATALVFVDVDGDRDLDLVRGANGQDQVLANDGRGRFVDARALPTRSESTTRVVAGDIDGDRDSDLIVAMAGTPWLRAYINNGRGSFTDAGVGALPRAVAAAGDLDLGDLDRDGDLDLVAAASSPLSGSFAWFNNGNGVFSATWVRFPNWFGGCREFALLDIDNDRDVDIVGRHDSVFAVFENRGTGTSPFVVRTSPASVFGQLGRLGIADVDADGDPDVVAMPESSSSEFVRPELYLNDGRGNFTDPDRPRLDPGIAMNQVLLGDLDGDRDPDLIDFELGHSKFNDGRGGFTDGPRLTPMTSQTVRDQLIDIDRDGDLDLVLKFDRTRKLLVNDGRGNFSDVTRTAIPASLAAAGMIAGDIDGDGDADLVGVLATSATPRLVLARNNGRGVFADATAGNVPAESLFWPMNLGDVDRDGDLDLVVSRSGAQILLLNDGTGKFTESRNAIPSVPQLSAATLLLGDVDGDTDLDMILFGQIGPPLGRNLMFLNDGKGRFHDVSARNMVGLVDGTRFAELGDVDLDGDLDVVQTTTFGLSFLLTNDGSGRLTPQRLPFRVRALADVDGDGDLDACSANMTGSHDALAINVSRHVDATRFVRLGHIHELDVYSHPSAAPTAFAVVPLIGLAETAILVPPFGALRLDPNLPLVPLPAMLTDKATSRAEYRLAVPSLPSLLGSSFYVQAIVEMQVGTQRSLRLTNVERQTFVGF